MRDDLYDALRAFADDPDARVAIISGEGEKGFCAGADLIEFGTAPSQVAAHRSRRSRDLWGLLASIRKPIVASMHGYVIGAGVEIACLCDVRVASEDAVFAMPEVSIGMIPGAGGTQSLPRVAGLGTAMERFLAARTDRMDASRALAAGILHRVVPRARLDEEALSLAGQMALRNPAVLSAIKSAVIDGLDVPLGAGLDMEGRLAAGL